MCCVLVSRQGVQCVWYGAQDWQPGTEPTRADSCGEDAWVTTELREKQRLGQTAHGRAHRQGLRSRACTGTTGLAQEQQGWHRNNRACTGTTGLAQQGWHSRAGTGRGSPDKQERLAGSPGVPWANYSKACACLPTVLQGGLGSSSMQA